MDGPSHFTKQPSPQGQKVLDQLEALGHRQNGRPTEHLIITPETSEPGQFTARLESSGTHTLAIGIPPGST